MLFFSFFLFPKIYQISSILGGLCLPCYHYNLHKTSMLFFIYLFAFLYKFTLLCTHKFGTVIILSVFSFKSFSLKRDKHMIQYFKSTFWTCEICEIKRKKKSERGSNFSQRAKKMWIEWQGSCHFQPSECKTSTERQLLMLYICSSFSPPSDRFHHSKASYESSACL